MIPRTQSLGECVLALSVYSVSSHSCQRLGKQTEKEKARFPLAQVKEYVLVSVYVELSFSYSFI